MWIFIVGSQLSEMQCIRKEIFEALRENSQSSFDEKLAILERKLSSVVKIDSFIIDTDERQKVKNFLSQFEVKWKESHRFIDQFSKKNNKYVHLLYLI